MEVSDQTWKVSIMHTGFYYVYSNVVFKTDANVDHVVVKEKEGYVILLLTCDLFVVTC